MNIPAKNNKVFDAYYDALDAYASQGVVHERATRLGFTNLLDSPTKQAGWTPFPIWG
jgi:hypothetical protein